DRHQGLSAAHGNCPASLAEWVSEPRQVRHMESKWIAWVRRLQAIAQNGLMFSKDPFDRERYEQVHSVAAEILASHTEVGTALISNLFREEQGYATPKLDVRGGVFHDNRVLLV